MRVTTNKRRPRWSLLFSIVVLVPVIGCNNAAKLLADCEARVRSLPKEIQNGKVDLEPWKEAHRLCARVKGEKAESLLEQIAESQNSVQAALELRQREEANRKKEADVRARQELMAQCKTDWASVCELDGRPTGGVFTGSTLDACDKKVRGFREMGAKCVECGCSDDLTKVMSGEMR